jgi:hypothetical protein
MCPYRELIRIQKCCVGNGYNTFLESSHIFPQHNWTYFLLQKLISGSLSDLNSPKAGFKSKQILLSCMVECYLSLSGRYLN